MKITVIQAERMTLEQFADKHGLEMEVVERPPYLNHPPEMRYYARLKWIDVKDGCGLLGVTGNGSTPEEAIKDYAPRISEKHLIFDALSKENRREIFAPVITT